jgi:hypothetical protein
MRTRPMIEISRRGAPPCCPSFVEGCCARVMADNPEAVAGLVERYAGDVK